MKIPLIDLVAQYQGLEKEMMERLTRVVRSQQFVLGPASEELELELARYCGTKRAVGLNSGTDALILGLKALGVGPGDEVITTPFSFFATASCIVHAGARPVFVDIEPETGLINVDLAARAITDKTRAIIPVHLFGQCADMDAITKLAKSAKLAVVEDACQAIGAEYKDRRAGAMSQVGALSFYPSKNLGGFGDGGIALTDDDDVAEKLKLLRNHGAYTEYGRDYLGVNSRLDALQAAALLVKLPHLDAWAARRRENAAAYDRLLKDLPVRPLALRAGRTHVYNNYVVRLRRRDELFAFLAKNGVGARIYYEKALHRMDCFAPYLPPGFSLPEAEQAAKECIALPCYPEMTDAMVAEVAALVRKFFEA